MVKGLDVFREHFVGFKDRYALIGGVASMLALEEAGLDARATKDLDIVLCVEALDSTFANAFWAFIDAGGYQIMQRSDGKKTFYRFAKPSDERYPFMLELFSRTPEGVILNEPATLTPIPIDEDVASLSAILLDADYYHLIFAGVRTIAEVPCVATEHLIPMKAHAWLDLNQRKGEGKTVDSKDIKKHRSDVIRLAQLLPGNARVELPDSIKEHLRRFLVALPADNFDARTVVSTLSTEQAIADISRVYSL